MMLHASDADLRANLEGADQADIAMHQPDALARPVTREAASTAEIVLLPPINLMKWQAGRRRFGQAIHGNAIQDSAAVAPLAERLPRQLREQVRDLHGHAGHDLT